MHAIAHINMVVAEATRVAGAVAGHCWPRLSAIQTDLAANSQRFTSVQDRPWRPWMNIFRPHHHSSKEQLSRASSQKARRLADNGVAHEREFDIGKAIVCFEEAIALEPSNAEYFSRLSKAWSDRTYEPGATPQTIQCVNKQAVEIAKKAIAADPHSSWGYIAACVSKGRLALYSDGRTKVQLAKEAQEDARLALQANPQDDLAHHLMGRWHYEMAGLNFVLRALVRVVYGTSLYPGSYEDALVEFKQAAELAPHRLVHRVEVGRTLHKLGHKMEALDELERAMDLEEEDINAHMQKEDAKLMVSRLRQELTSVVRYWP